ncbi:probable receptor-like protein kinase At1g30570 [Impatiens glandulifera]|uniref:probable receptor-like protein kinase At1g30570 n=1 Tax=Impatiens glandulifera TaxID=253017 RepID=UPI001FB0B016|nr:probable receptor-like protein kinase At1g30570 [Impatiens glandulifera]
MVKDTVYNLGLIYVVILCINFGYGEAIVNTFLINCGTNGSVTIDGRIWIGDMEPNNNVTFSSGIVVTNSSYNGDSSFSMLYTTARIFTDSLNYTFIGARGNYILRLHFYPISFQNYDINKSFFSVEANGVKLLSKFNVPGEISLRKSHLQGSDNSSSLILIDEYFLNNDIETLVIHFVPDEGLFGYVNAIEIVPVVDSLFVETVNKVGSGSSSSTGSSLNLGKRGIQTMYRLNVGGSEIKPDDDDLWRNWKVDTGYMLTSNAGFEIKNKSRVDYASDNNTIAAPLMVYETGRSTSNADVLEKRFNMSWKFVVDPGFDYLVRLHFCELEFDQPSQRSFRIYINNRTAADNFDILSHAGGKNRGYHQDYLDSVPAKIDTIWIQLGPDIALGSSESDALLNGLEIFKLSQNGNLAHIEDYGPLELKKSSKNLILWVGAGSGLAIIAILISITVFLCFRKRRGRNKPSDVKTWRPLFLNGSLVNSTANAKGTVRNVNPSSLATGGSSRHFTLTEIKSATNNFDESLLLGVGGFGKVYKGELEEGITVAIKRANPQSEQGLKEFQTEVEMLSRLRHRHLVSMIGFCEEHNEMILVYEYMANGTLRGHLIGNDITPLKWKQRLEICIGAARGLHYLHTGSERGIIHRDVKTTNILLDENLVAKMADFGLSKTGPSLEHTHVSTAVKGSFGYLDPEYFRRQQLTEKSDVYSFGVVLFEALCARPVINPSLPKDQINLAEWAMRWQRQRSLKTIIDPHLKGEMSEECLEKFGEIAEKCLGDEGKSRPTMGEVLWHLESLLQIHESWIRDMAGEDEEGGGGGDSFSSNRGGPARIEDVVESV